MDNNEIRYGSKMIRRKYARKEDNQQPNHAEKMTCNIWGYYKKTFHEKMKLNHILTKKRVKRVLKMFSNSAISTKYSIYQLG